MSPVPHFHIRNQNHDLLEQVYAIHLIFYFDHHFLFLKKLKIDKNTIVVFTSDNGPWLPFKTHGGSAGLLKEGKGTTWEGGMRVPTIFWSPSNIKPAIISDTGSTMDLFSTFISKSFQVIC